MNLYLLIIFFLCIIGNKFYLKSNNDEYMSKENTSSVKGIFILLIIYSHSLSYASYNTFSGFINKFAILLGQLVVTMFLFYSGYGIYESYKKKGDKYLSDFPKNRILKTLVNFDLVLILYLILYIIINKTFPIKQTLLSFIGWDSLGNSNWYIFDILILYTLSYFSFLVFDKKNAIKSTWVLTIVLILFLALYKEPWWYNTILCFPFGMTYSYYKDKIENILFDNKKYIIVFICTLFMMFVFKKYSNFNYFYYELLSIVFSIFIVLLTVKIKFNNKILKWFGDNLFWIYILQRIPMIILSNYFSLCSYLFFIISFIFTIILSITIKFLINSFLYLKKSK